MDIEEMNIEELIKDLSEHDNGVSRETAELFIKTAFNLGRNNGIDYVYREDINPEEVL